MTRARIAGAIGFCIVVVVALGASRAAEGEAWWRARESASAPASAVKPPAAGAAQLASIEPVFGVGADQLWTVMTGGYVVEAFTTPPPVPMRGAPGRLQGSIHLLRAAEGAELTLDGRNRYASDVEVSAWVRLPRANAGARFHFARHEAAADPKEPAKPRAQKYIGVSLRMDGSAEKVSCAVDDSGGELFDNKAIRAKSNWGDSGKSSSLNYAPRAYTRFLPGWPEEKRARIEADMAGMPGADERWYALRVELAKGGLRVWLDDRIIAHKRDEAMVTEGAMKIALSAGVELAGFAVRPLAAPTPGFEAIRLGGYANGRAIGGAERVEAASLPPAETPVTIDGVPFVFAGVHYGCDHLDVSRSYLREANEEGYLETTPYRYTGAAVRDSARVQVRVPNGQYDALYVVAAAEDKPDTVPLLTAAFYRPAAGFAESFEARVPVLTAQTGPADAKPLPVKLAGGAAGNLWLIKIPLDPGRLSSFGDMDVVEIEFTKRMALFRSYPDPINYGYHPAGPPSSVHVFAATLVEAPVGFSWEPDAFGHVWQAPAQPAYTATLVNRTGAEQQGKLTLSMLSHNGTDEAWKEVPVSLPAPAAGKTPTPVPVRVAMTAKLYGHYDIVATLQIAGRTWMERRSFVRLAPDTRSATWTGKGALFGYWSYRGGHHTPDAWQIQRLMTMGGGRMYLNDEQMKQAPPDVQARLAKHNVAAACGAWEVAPQGWMADEPLDMAKVADFQKKVVAAYKQSRERQPAELRPDHMFFFPEPHISARLTAGNIPDYWGEKPYELTDGEKRNLRMFMNSAKYAAEAVRKEFPGVKVLIPWGDAGFAWPLLRAGFPKELIDGCGIDTPNFERVPERQLHEQSTHRLLYLKREFEKFGNARPDLFYCEGIFVPTEPGAVSYREQMDIYHRWSLLSMAYGVRRFYSGWFAFDCGNYYGAEHYGGCGIQRRIPYCDPKPAYAAFATMTDRLNEAEFDGWAPTGSLSTYALRFKHETRGATYALWTIRGKRPATIEFDKDATVRVTDSMNNTREVKSKDKRVTITTDPSVVYVTLAPSSVQLTSINVGEPDHGDAKPAASAAQVADLADGSWKFTNERDEILEKNHWAVMHYAGKFSAAVVDDPAQGRVLQSKLEKQDAVHELMPWYNVLQPVKPIALKGAPSKLGLWVKGTTDWGRVIYVLHDAKGERWTSIGTKDQYNCDDAHSWSEFNFDGWRYLTFELPGHYGYDNFRKYGTTWWRGGDGDGAINAGVVDLPLALEAIVVEQRTHVLYVNDVQPAKSDTVRLGKLFVEYDDPADASDEAVRQSRLRMPAPKEAANLPNPIARFGRKGQGEPVRITRLEPPTHAYDGTRMHVHFTPNPGAKAHHLWVSAHADGQAAVDLTPGGLKPGELVQGLRAGIPLYYWIVWIDKDGKPSKPSPAHREVTVDNFKEK